MLTRDVAQGVVADPPPALSISDLDVKVRYAHPGKAGDCAISGTGS
ncbi:MAG TPA: hypothetical protein VMV07_12625 [Streptosporangiaceae bacterium]|nr:hypothetical protein [Streptosporangiaceae bacterium]